MKKIILLTVACLLLAGSAFATEFYCVKNAGTKNLDGASLSGDYDDLASFGWANADCYPTLDDADDAMGAKATDVMVLNTGETLSLGADVTPSATIINRNNDTDYSTCTVDVETYKLTYNQDADFLVKGIEFKNRAADADPVFVFTNSTGSSKDISFISVKFDNNVTTSTIASCIRINVTDVIHLKTTNCVFSNNITASCGVIGASDKKFEWTDSYSMFTSNSSTVGKGGAVYLRSAAGHEANVNLTGTTFTSNEAGTGGAPSNHQGGALHIDENVVLELILCTFTGNTTAREGGAIYVDNDSGGVAIDSCVFDSNISTMDTAGNGGAIYVDGNDGAIIDVTIIDSTFNANESGYRGWAVSLVDCNLIMSGSTISNNVGNRDDAVVFANGAFWVGRSSTNRDINITVDISDCTFSGNWQHADTDTTGDGAGLLIKGTDDDAEHDDLVIATISDCIFSDNFNYQGAGFYCGRYATATVIRTKFLNNVSYRTGGATYSGGGLVECLGETAEFRSCSFIGNKAGYEKDGVTAADNTGYGGAACTRTWPKFIFKNCSFLENTTRGGTGDAIYCFQDGGSTFDHADKRSELYNCVFWDVGGSAYQIDADDAVDAQAYSAITNCAYASGEFNANTSSGPTSTVTLTATSPFVSTSDAHLKAGSPCIWQGTDLSISTDLDGQPFHATTPSIGAYEFKGHGLGSTFPGLNFGL